MSSKSQHASKERPELGFFAVIGRRIEGIGRIGSICKLAGLCPAFAIPAGLHNPSLSRAPPLVQSQMAEVFKSLVYSDYPDNWPGLLEAVYGHLTSQVRAGKGALQLRGAVLNFSPPVPFTVAALHMTGPGPQVSAAMLVSCGCSSCNEALGRTPFPPPCMCPTLVWTPPAPRQDELRVHGALMALRLMARKYEFRDEVSFEAVGGFRTGGRPWAVGQWGPTSGTAFPTQVVR
jgi:hypothetical protein